MQVGGAFGHLNLTQLHAVEIINPDAAGRRDIDVAVGNYVKMKESDGTALGTAFGGLYNSFVGYFDSAISTIVLLSTNTERANLLRRFPQQSWHVSCFAYLLKKSGYFSFHESSELVSEIILNK